MARKEILSEANLADFQPIPTEKIGEKYEQDHSNKGVNLMTICPIAIAVGCKKCPAFKFCPLTTVLGDQEEKDEIDPSNKVWEENFPTADEHLDKMDELEKNKNEESKKE